MYRMGAIALVLAAGNAWAGDCDHEQRLDRSLDLSGASVLKIDAAAGSLDIEGRPDTGSAQVVARLCASSQELLDETRLILEAGNEARIAVDIPDTDGGFFGGNRYAYVDLEIRVPETLPLDVRDSSGGMDIENVGALKVKDSSGHIDISDVNGPVELSDSSGGIELEDIEGDVHIVSDSSGEISGEDINGSVLVSRDSSGSIQFENVQGDVVVERDSSGSISVRNVGGDFRVGKDGSGGISHKNVTGSVEVPARH
ncbi:hypothetical protein F3N42_05835 [Marinihelvus fidelis]|uniref:DUF4097 domain-containing protein n=1 Tax=Marinihelvus fidelis TaxID=2613842 RepID=A0A5N0TCC1_9GAMM|nr:hypothetical protein [Marinihelvus fidelis]KAA9132733.1 hypothetical protein F3N42_05835 [Marinihelvus fidelis]